MIKYFKKLRLASLSSSQLSKYLMYAIGEILLVVVGILIALSANNHSQYKKELSSSNIHLNNMLEDLVSDTLYLAKMLDQMEMQLTLEEWMFHKAQFTEGDIDSIIQSMSPINWLFNMNDRAFQNIQHSNENKLVGFEHLYNDISQHYVITKARINQNNLVEQQSLMYKYPYEKILNEHLLITKRQFIDHTGFNVVLTLTPNRRLGNTNEVFDHLISIEAKNDQSEKFARHNFIFTSLFMCQVETKKLIRLIEESLK